MQRRSILAFIATIALIVLLVSTPLAQAEVSGGQPATTAQLVSTGSIYDQIDSMLNNLTKRFDVNPLTPTNPQVTPKVATPSVKIADVKISNQGQQNTKPRVTVTLQNGNAAVNSVRVSVFYTTTSGSIASSNSTVVSLSKGETRGIEFSPDGLAAGSYGVSVVAFKDGTDPSNKATPPYDMRENAATLTVTPTPTTAPAEKAAEVQSNPNAFGDLLSQVNTWILFIIAITLLITIALFFVFSQNKSGEDRFEEDHFKDEYPPGDVDKSEPFSTPSRPPTTEQPPEEPTGTVASPRRRQILIDAAETDESARTTSYGAVHQPSADRSFNSDGYVIGDVSSKKALRNKIRGKKGT